MKFDPSRVLATVSELCDSRFSSPDGELQIADLVSIRLAGAGWDSERIEVSVPTGRIKAVRSPVIVARRPLENPPSLRVVIHAPLRRKAPEAFRTRLAGYVKSLLGQQAEADSDFLLTPGDVGGIAMVLELARSWPKSWSRRFELVLAVTISQPSSSEGSYAIAHEFDPVRTGVPTLVIPLFATGVGRDLILVGGRSRELALASAASLWIPVSPIDSKSMLRRFWPATMSQTFPDHVASIGGDIEKESSQPLNADALQRTADLIAEIALRWS